MKTGVELIAQERNEQITKHGRTLEQDAYNNKDYQLSGAAVSLITGNRMTPFEWDARIFNKMMDKCYLDRLIIAGALIAAEIDRINPKQ